MEYIQSELAIQPHAVRVHRQNFPHAFGCLDAWREYLIGGGMEFYNVREMRAR